MEYFEKCTVAMLGGPRSQHVKGNTSRQNQPQSAIKWNIAHPGGLMKDPIKEFVFDISINVPYNFPI